MLRATAIYIALYFVLVLGDYASTQFVIAQGVGSEGNCVVRSEDGGLSSRIFLIANAVGALVLAAGFA